MERFIKIYRYFIIGAAACLFLFILYHFLSIDGRFNVNYNFCRESNQITELSPTGRALDIERNTKTGDCYQRLTGEPVYFSVNSPRSFTQADITLTYKNPSQNIVELGVIKSISGAADLKSLENKFIDSSEWEKLTDKNLILFQKEKKFNSIKEFVDNLPVSSKIATYNYTPEFNFTIPDYRPQSQSTEFNQAFRGKHEFYTYIKDENLDFTFYWQDLNWAQEHDNFTVGIYKNDVEINTAYAASDNTKDIHEKNIKISNLSEGVYKIVVNISDDIIVSKIKTQQHLLVARNKLFLANNKIYSDALPNIDPKQNEIITNADSLMLKTDDESGLQTVNIGNDEIKINQAQIFFTWQPKNNIVGSEKKIIIPKSDMLLQGSAYFSFSQDSFFDPDYTIDKIQSNTDINQYDYLIAADYTNPIVVTGWKQKTVHLDLNGVVGDRKTLNFVISAPGLADAKDDITVKNISVELTREPINWRSLFSKIISKLK